MAPPLLLSSARTLVVACIATAVAGCGETDSLTRQSPPAVAAHSRAVKAAPATEAASFAGGIPIGTFSQPLSEFGERYNGGMRTIPPESLLIQLQEVEARSGRLVLSFVGNERHFRDDSGHFSLSKWQARVDRFAGIDFTSYIENGTIIGHYMLDEPNDPTNWNGRTVPGATLEEMAHYSKQRWPGMATIVRTEPAYLAKWGIAYRHLDAAWAQYVHRKGDVNDFIRRHVADAGNMGLGLAVGLNILRGNADGGALTAAQVEEWGSALLSSDYPCAFISWQYDATYLADGAVGAAMDVLRGQAQNRSPRDCERSAPSPDPVPVATATEITSAAPDPSAPGQGVTVNVSVTSAKETPVGSVSVTVSGGGESCGITLSGGSGSCALSLTETGDRTIAAAYEGGPAFAGSSDTEPHRVRAAAQDVAITWPTPQDITYGTALGPTQLNATAAAGGQAVPGTFSYQPAAGTLLNAGAQRLLTTTFTPSDPAAYRGGTATTRINVLRARPTLRWTVPVSTLVGPLDARLLNAAATGVGGAALPGTFTYTPSAGTVLDATRSRTLSVVFRPSSTNYTTANKSVTIAVLYPFSGFFEPVNNPKVLNTVKAGRALPVRFGLGGNRTLAIFTAGSPEVRTATCPAWTADAIEQTVTATSSSLRYDAATRQYVYTWKTSTAWAGGCRKLILTFKEGTRREATFKLLP